MPKHFENDLPYWVALASHPKIGSATFRKLLARFQSLESVWRTDGHRLTTSGLDRTTVKIVQDAKAKIDPEKTMRFLSRNDIGVITLADQSYPKLLREIADPPAVLFVRGKIYPNDLAIGVVGSRKFSYYGKRATEYIVPELVANDLTIVSGLALGIDSIAHLATINCGGRTIAVLGSGIDRLYPAGHRHIAEKIISSGGSIVTEFPPGTPSYPSNFPIRNRIIAGLSLGVVVVEAASDSGSLLTAKAALEYNREVFAVPGDIFRDTAYGTNNLIKMGAKTVATADDILVELNLREKRASRRAREIHPETPEEKILLEHLGVDPVHIDTLSKASKIDISKVGSALILMEMKGMVKNVGGNQYVKAG